MRIAPKYSSLEHSSPETRSSARKDRPQHNREGGVGLVCEAHRLLYHSTLGLRVIKKKGWGVPCCGRCAW